MVLMNKIEDWSRKVKLILIISLLCLLLCSCQKTSKMTVYADLSSSSQYSNDLDVINEDYQDALNRCQKRLNEVPADSLAAAEAYKIMGGIYAGYLDDKDNATYYINKAIQIDERENYMLGLAQDYNHMSKIYICIGGDPSEGMEYVDKAQEICEKYGLSDTLEMAGTWVNKGRLYNIKGEPDKAIDYMNQAQEIYIRKQKEYIKLYIEIGQIYLAKGEYEKANEEYLKAKKICESEGDDYYLAEVIYQIGWLYRKQEDYQTAIDYYEQALEYFKKNGHIKEEALICNNIAFAAAELGWELEQVIPIAIDASRAIEKIIPETIPSSKSKKNYKHNLKDYYMEWSKDESEEGFETWYQKVVIEGNDWKESV